MSTSEEKLDRRLKRALQKNSILEAMMEDRTRELFVQQQTIIAAKNDLLSIIFSLNHDLRAPLSTIIGFTQAIDEDLEDACYEEVPAFTGRIRDSCTRLQGLIANLVGLTNHRDTDAPAETINFPDLFGQLEGVLASTDPSASVEVTHEINHTSALVVNRTKLFHILLNLVSNGIKYRDANKATQFVTVLTSDSLSPGKFSIRIQDNGLGIAESELPKVFEMFYRCQRANRSGSGLGLYLVKSHVESMDGEIRVQSGAEGSTFTLEFPLARPDQTPSVKQ